MIKEDAMILKEFYPLEDDQIQLADKFPINGHYYISIRNHPSEWEVISSS